MSSSPPNGGSITRGVKVLCDGFGWLEDAAEEAAARHDVIALTEAQVARAWADPSPDWWRAAVPEGWEPDVALFTCPEYRAAPPRLDALPCPVALWVGDWLANAQAVGWIADQAELVLADAVGARALRRAGVRNVAELSPWTFRPGVHVPDWDAPAERDIGFLGSVSGAVQHERNRWLGRLAQLPGDVRVELDDRRSGADAVRFLQRSRIAFNFSLTGDVNLRAFEAAACGALTMIDAGAAQQAARWFELGTEIVVYDEHDLEDQIAHLLDHEDERMAIAEAGWRRVQQHGPQQRMQQLLRQLEALAAGGRRVRVGAARAGGAAAAYALSVAPAAEDLGGVERLLDDAETAHPDDPAVQVHRARLYAFLFARRDERAATALRWSDDHLRRALELDPRDAVARLCRAQLVAAVQPGERARTMALELADDLRAGRAVARADRIPILDPMGEQILRQRAILADRDPQRELSRLTLVRALRLAAECSEDPGPRAELLTEAVALAPDDPSIRLDLVVCCFSLAPETAIAHTRLLLASQPINPAVWMLHAHALVAAGRHEEAASFGAEVELLAARAQVDDEHLRRVRAAVALARAHRPLVPAPA
ncbi:MAG TPA: glycosyltransferase [Capillimicrobium sp.]|jgi:hypothetical protein